MFSDFLGGVTYSEYLSWHVANTLSSLTTFLFINRCPPPVLGHHPFLVNHEHPPGKSLRPDLTPCHLTVICLPSKKLMRRGMRLGLAPLSWKELTARVASWQSNALEKSIISAFHSLNRNISDNLLFKTYQTLICRSIFNVSRSLQFILLPLYLLTLI